MVVRESFRESDKESFRESDKESFRESFRESGRQGDDIQPLCLKLLFRVTTQNTLFWLGFSSVLNPTEFQSGEEIGRTTPN